MDRQVYILIPYDKNMSEYKSTPKTSEHKITLDSPITKLSSDRQNLEGLKYACKINKENNFNSLDILVPIAEQMLNNMHSDDLLEFIENRYETLRLRLDNNYFNLEAE